MAYRSVKGRYGITLRWVGNGPPPPAPTKPPPKPADAASSARPGARCRRAVGGN